MRHTEGFFCLAFLLISAYNVYWEIVRRQAMEGYPSVREISYKWNVSERWVSKLAQDGRIHGMERFGRS